MMWIYLACASDVDGVNDFPIVDSATYFVEWSGLTDGIIDSNSIRLSRFEVVLYSLRLPECADFTRHLWGINSAMAGHSDISIPSNWMQPTVLNFLESGQVEHEVEFSTQSLCELGVTYARWDGSTNNVVDDAEIPFSILLEGVCLDTERPFRLETKVPSEQIHDIANLVTGLGNNVHVHLEIPLDNVLNPLDCSQLDTWSATETLEVLSEIQTNSIWSVELNDD